MQQLGARVVSAFLEQHGSLFLWVPVCLGGGISIYFSLRFEPGPVAAILLFMAASALWGWARRAGEVMGPISLGVAIVLAGILLAMLRAQSVVAPVLAWRYYGPVEGRIVGIDRSASDAVRLTLDRVRLGELPPDKTPNRVRISLHGPIAAAPVPGAFVMTTASLSPPEGPVEPGGFDFQRHAWFLKLGAVGYTRVPLMLIAPPNAQDVRIFRMRMWLSRQFQEGVGGDMGAFAAAVIAGDRSGMSREATQALRVSNLAHLLAISGLHMGLLAGFVFAFSRRLLAVLPRVSLYWPVTQISAVTALMAATVYLLLSGGSIATERAYVMVAVTLVAVLVGRRAISLRSVALAATIVLLLQPEAILSPGFQMSFAATVALVVVFGIVRAGGWRANGWKGWVGTLLISSTAAGLATAPFAAAQFNQIASYGLIANLLAVPAMGTIVIPSAVIAVLLMPVGLQWVPMWVMGKGLGWILAVAEGISQLEGARRLVPSPPEATLPLLTLGALFIVLWVGRARWLGIVPVLLAFWLWTGVERPLILIAQSGGLVGVMTDEGRALSRDKAQGFVASVWLENDGDPVAQWQAAARWPKNGDRVLHVTGKRAAAALGPCGAGQIVVMNVPRKTAPDAHGCDIFDTGRLAATGAVALVRKPDGWSMTTAREISGERYWTDAGNFAPFSEEIREFLQPMRRSVPLASRQ